MNKFFLSLMFLLKAFQIQASDSIIDLNSIPFFVDKALSELPTQVPPSIVDYRPHFENMMYNPKNPVLRIIFSSRHVNDFERLMCVDLLISADANKLAIDILNKFQNHKIARRRLKNLTYVIPEENDDEILDAVKKLKEEQTLKLSKAKEYLETHGKRTLGLSMLNKIAKDPDTLLTIKRAAKNLATDAQKKRMSL